MKTGSDDLIIALQKITALETGAVQGLLGVQVIEYLHGLVEKKDDFVVQNIKSTLRLVSE